MIINFLNRKIVALIELIGKVWVDHTEDEVCGTFNDQALNSYIERKGSAAILKQLALMTCQVMETESLIKDKKEIASSPIEKGF